MFFHVLEPFIILPYKDKQDVLYFPKDSLKEYADDLKNTAYLELPNTIVRDNLIKVCVGYNYVIIFHIYPTDFIEKASGRGGQNLIIGYVIRKKSLIKNFNAVVQSIGMFFDSVAVDTNMKDVPTSFVSKVNSDGEWDVWERLDICRMGINNRLIGEYRCVNFLENEYDTRRSGAGRCKEVKFESLNRLQSVYEYIAKCCIMNRTSWVLVDCDNSDYYNLRNMHCIVFS